jgi:hypothetical protein
MEKKFGLDVKNVKEFQNGYLVTRSDNHAFYYIP